MNFFAVVKPTQALTTYTEPSKYALSSSSVGVAVNQLEYHRNWLIGTCAYRFQQQQNMTLLQYMYVLIVVISMLVLTVYDFCTHR